MPQFTEQFDVVVVGAGHAGCEAAMAAARMGLKTALYTLNVDLIAQMSCNPAIGGIAKGHLVREVDALGGIMGEITDAVGIQFRLLNTSRGPAVWSPRAQCDKQAYRLKMREVLESQPNLKIKQAEVADLILEQSSVVSRQSSAESPRLVIRGAQPTSESISPTTNDLTNATTASPRHPAPRRPHRRRAGRHHHHRHLSQRPDPLRRAAISRRTFRRTRRRPARRSAEATRPARMPPQDRHPAAPRRPHHRLVAFRGAARRCRSHAVQLSHQARRASRLAGALLHRVDHAGNAPHHPRKRSPLADVQRPDPFHRPALLPFDRRQDRQVSRQDHAPALPRARGPEHARDLRQRHEHVAAGRSAAGDSEVDPRPRKRRDAAPGLRHRVRLHRSHRTGAHARNQEDRRPVSRRTDQRHQRLRRSRLPGPDGRHQRRAASEERSRR